MGWYVVHFWDLDPIVGPFLNHQKFDDYEEALKFAKSHNTIVERSKGF